MPMRRRRATRAPPARTTRCQRSIENSSPHCGAGTWGYGALARPVTREERALDHAFAFRSPQLFSAFTPTVCPHASARHEHSARVEFVSMKRTIITGGTRGSGAATATRLRAGDHDVIALGSEADAVDHDAVATAFARSNEDGRGLTGLVVSAGIWEPSPLGDDLASVARQHRRVIDVNVIGAVNAMGAFLRHARRGESTSVVLVGSTAGQRGESGHGAYAASKAAL